MNITKFLFLILTLTALTQCKNVRDYVFEEEDLEFIDELTIVGDKRMNRGYPLKIDFVVIKHPMVAEQVGKLSAHQFMQQRKQLKHDYPKLVKIKSFEITPGQSVVLPLKYLKKEVKGAFIFADFNTYGMNRWSIYSADYVKVYLMEKTLKITSHNINQHEKIKVQDDAKGVIFVDK